MHRPNKYSEVKEVIQQIFDEHPGPLWRSTDHIGITQPRLLKRFMKSSTQSLSRKGRCIDTVIENFFSL